MWHELERVRPGDDKSEDRGYQSFARRMAIVSPIRHIQRRLDYGVRSTEGLVQGRTAPLRVSVH